MALVDVHVDLRRADVFVSEHRLDGPQIGTALQELRGEAVAEGVRTDALLDTRLLGIRLDIDEERDAAEVLAASQGDEHVVFLARLYRDALPHDEPLPQLLDGALADGNQPLLPPLAVNADVPLLEIELA